jgi:hypothetical protein
MKKKCEDENVKTNQTQTMTKAPAATSRTIPNQSAAKQATRQYFNHWRFPDLYLGAEQLLHT